MCNFASAIITKDHVYFGKTDSHGDIIVEHQLHEGAGRVNFVLVEITPPGRDLSADLATWDYHAVVVEGLLAPADQWGHYYYELPKWYDPVRDEARARTALAASKLLPLKLTYDRRVAALGYRTRKAMKPAQAAYQKARAAIAAQPW